MFFIISDKRDLAQLFP